MISSKDSRMGESMTSLTSPPSLSEDSNRTT